MSVVASKEPPPPARRLRLQMDGFLTRNPKAQASGLTLEWFRQRAVKSLDKAKTEINVVFQQLFTQLKRKDAECANVQAQRDRLKQALESQEKLAAANNQTVIHLREQLRTAKAIIDEKETKLHQFRLRERDNTVSRGQPSSRSHDGHPSNYNSFPGQHGQQPSPFAHRMHSSSESIASSNAGLGHHHNHNPNNNINRRRGTGSQADQYGQPQYDQYGQPLHKRPSFSAPWS